MTALDAYQMAVHGIVLHTETCATVNRKATMLADTLADDGREVEPDPDLTILWDTSDLIRGHRPRDHRWRRMNGTSYMIPKRGEIR
jgi:hypothetical protein